MAFIVFFTTFIVYLSTLAPSFTVGDSAEFAASGIILGLPHSPGYPLYTLIGKAFSILVPFGNYAYRFNLLSAVFASVSSVVLYFLILSFTPDSKNNKNKIMSVMLSLMFSLSHANWSSAIQTEVFSLNVLFALSIILLLKYDKILITVFVFALGLGNHHTLVFIAPLIMCYIYKNKLISKDNTIKFALFFALGFSVYLYLYIRAYKMPGLNWGNPQNLRNLYRVISRADYGTLSLTAGEKQGLTLNIIAKQLIRYFSMTGRQFLFPGLLLGIYGWYKAVKDNLSYSKELLFVFVFAGPFFILLSNLPFDAQSEGILERFYIFTNILWVLSISFAYISIFKKYKHIVLAVLIVHASSLLFANYSVVNWRNHYLSYDYGKNLLKTLPRNAVLFMDGGDDTFYGLAYMCFAENRRTDLELHDRGGLVFKSVYGKDFRSLSKDEKEQRRVQTEFNYLSRKPLYYSTFNKKILPNRMLKPNGVLYTAGYYEFVNSWPLYSMRGVYGTEYSDYRSNALVPIYPYFASIHKPESKMEYLAYTIGRWPQVIWVASNIKGELIFSAYDEFAEGKTLKSKEMYEYVLKYFPNEVSSMVNLGVIEDKLGNSKTAEALYLKAIETDPKYAESYYNLAVLYWKKEDWQSVVRYLNALKALKPDDERVKRFLPKAIMNMRIKQNG